MTPAVLGAALVAATLAVCARAGRAVARARATRDLPRAGGRARPHRWTAPRRVRQAAEELDVAHDVERLWRAWSAAVLVAPVGALVLAGPGLAALVAAVVISAPPVAWRTNRGRRVARLEASLPFALEAVARSLRSGAALPGAIAEAAAAVSGPLRVDLTGVARAAEAVGVVAALERWGRERAIPGIRLAVAALCLGAETGGARAQAIDGVATTLRQRLAVAAEARALASQARASAAVIALAPIAFCGLASSTDARVGAFLFRSGAGVAVLTAGLVLDALGAVWMARLTRVSA